MPSDPKIPSISVSDLRDLTRRKEIDIIDVRTPEEFAEVRLPNARNFPLDQLDAQEIDSARIGNGGEPIYFVCAIGVRSEWACAAMMAAGYANVVNVEGGTNAWVAAGFPHVAGDRR